MKIYDCFTYYNESNIIQIRFEELDDIVDYFVVVESSQTFTGIPKPFYFDDLPSWIDKWKDRIIRVKVDFPDTVNSSWEREHFQRNSIVNGLSSLTYSDLVIISDADEVPKASVLKNITKHTIPSRLDVKQYFWNYNWQSPDHCNQGSRPVVCGRINLEINTCQELRSLNLPVIPDAGWHFSFFGETERIKNKIESFAHTEYDNDEFKNYDNILYRIENGIDPFDRFPLKKYDIDHTYPAWVQSIYGH